MKRVLLALLGALAATVLAVVGLALTKPDVIEVSRSIVVEAQPQDITPHLHDFDKFVKWSPWSALDPNQKTEISDPAHGVGAKYAWEGNDQVGVGYMENISITETRVEQNLVFTAPWQSNASVYYDLEPQGDQTKVTWGFSEPAGFSNKLMQVFISMDDMLGPEYEKGLATLQPIVEAEAKARIEAEQAAAQAEAEAADADEVADAAAR